MKDQLSIPLNFALLCENCRPVTICDSRDAVGEICPTCKGQYTLLSLARVLNPTPELGAITYINRSIRFFGETKSLDQL